MRRSSVLILVASLSGLGTAALADETAETAKPSTCYVSSTDGAGQITCLNENGEPSALEAVAVTVESSDPAAPPTESLRFTITGAPQIQHAFGLYMLRVAPAEILTIGIKPIIEGGDFKDLVTPIRYAGRGGGAYRGGGAAYRRGGAVAYRGGGYRRGAAVVGGAVVGGAVGAAAAGGYCDPNYYDCSGYGYGGGYYAPGVAAGAVVGGAVAAGAYRRGGAVAYRGGAAVRRGGGAHVAHRGGGGRRR